MRVCASGSALIVSLVFLLLLTLLGLAAMRDTGLQERMAGNFDQRNQAFQLAELGLRLAEREYADSLRVGGQRPLTYDLDEVDWPSACPDIDEVGCSGSAIATSPQCMAAFGSDFWRQASLPTGQGGSARYMVVMHENLMANCTPPSGISRDIAAGASGGAQTGGSEADSTRLFLAEGVAPDGTTMAIVQAMFLGPDAYALTDDDDDE